GDVRADLHFTRGGELQVRVADGASGAPIAGAVVTVMEKAFTGAHVEGYGAQHATTDDRGLCVLAPLGDDVPAVSVRAPGYGTELGGQPLHAAAGSPPLLAVTLEQGGSIEGTIDVPYMAPEMVLTVLARPMGWEQGLTAKADRDRHYRIDDLPAGPIEV